MNNSESFPTYFTSSLNIEYLCFLMLQHCPGVSKPAIRGKLHTINQSMVQAQLPTMHKPMARVQLHTVRKPMDLLSVLLF